MLQCKNIISLILDFLDTLLCIYTYFYIGSNVRSITLNTKVHPLKTERDLEEEVIRAIF